MTDQTKTLRGELAELSREWHRYLVPGDDPDGRATVLEGCVNQVDALLARNPIEAERDAAKLQADLRLGVIEKLEVQLAEVAAERDEEHERFAEMQTRAEKAEAQLAEAQARIKELEGEWCDDCKCTHTGQCPTI